MQKSKKTTTVGKNEKTKMTGKMRKAQKAFFALCLVLLTVSCATQKGLAPQERATSKGRGAKTEKLVIDKEEIYYTEKEIEIETDTAATLNIVSQIPRGSLIFWDANETAEIKTRKIAPRSLLTEVPQSFFFNSIQAANEFSAFAKNSPADARGIFGDLLGITELANGTQKVIFGIIPKTARSMEFRFELPVSDTAKILSAMIAKYNSRFDATFSNDKIILNRRPEYSDGSKTITYKEVQTAQDVFAVGGEEDIAMLLFKRSDLSEVRNDLRHFRITEFDRFTVSAWLNPILEFEANDFLANLLRNTDIYKTMDYDLQVFNAPAREQTGEEQVLEKDSIVIIYEQNDHIAFETAMVLSDYLRRVTQKTVVAFADVNQQKLFFLNFDIAVSAQSSGLDGKYLSRKFLGQNFSEENIENLRLRTKLFEMRIYLCSPQRIIAGPNENGERLQNRNVISRMEVVK